MDPTEVDEATLIDRAKQGDPEAFSELYGRYDRQIYGFIRVRAGNEDDAQEIAQKTRIVVWGRMPTYDPDRSSFPWFAKKSSGFVLLQHFAAKKKRSKVEVIFSELIARFPELEEDAEVEAIISRLAVQEEPPEENEDEEEHNLDKVYEELLCSTFNGPSPPHQLIAFGFVKLLAWTPREVVAKLSDIALRELEERLETDYVNKSQLPKDRVEPCFRQLRENLDRSLRDTVTEKRTLDTYPHLHARIVGDTTLRDYYTKQAVEGQADNIVKWWDAVTRRVRKEVQKEAPQPPARKAECPCIHKWRT